MSIKFKIIFIFIFIFLINKTKSVDCSKEEPILFNIECKNYYCTETQFENGECTISNSAVKKQWLNNIISLT